MSSNSYSTPSSSTNKKNGNARKYSVYRVFEKKNEDDAKRKVMQNGANKEKCFTKCFTSVLPNWKTWGNK